MTNSKCSDYGKPMQYCECKFNTPDFELAMWGINGFDKKVVKLDMIYYPYEFTKHNLHFIELARYLALDDNKQDLTNEMKQYLGHWYHVMLEDYLFDLVEL